MEEQDLKDLWNKGNQKAGDYFKSIEEEVTAKAKSTSHDVILKVKRNAIIELVVCYVLFAFFEILYVDMPFYLAFTIFMVVLMGFISWFYLRFLNKIKKAQRRNLLESIKENRSILKTYVNWMHWIVYATAPLVIPMGILFATPFLKSIEDPALLVLIYVLVIIPLLVVWVLFGKRYVFWLYGKHLKKLNEIIAGFESED